jgi:hypothetical protein
LDSVVGGTHSPSADRSSDAIRVLKDGADQILPAFGPRTQALAALRFAPYKIRRLAYRRSTDRRCGRNRGTLDGTLAQSLAFTPHTAPPHRATLGLRTRHLRFETIEDAVSLDFFTTLLTVRYDCCWCSSAF